MRNVTFPHFSYRLNKSLYTKLFTILSGLCRATKQGVYRK